jgi:hypothetical protein
MARTKVGSKRSFNSRCPVQCLSFECDRPMEYDREWRENNERRPIDARFVEHLLLASTSESSARWHWQSSLMGGAVVVPLAAADEELPFYKTSSGGRPVGGTE